MVPTRVPDQIVLLGNIVTPATSEVVHDGKVVRIEPKSMEVLVHLMTNAGEVVSREALQEAIWGEVIVGDDSLTNTIIKLRKAFGDDARNPRLIETIPKRGYRLIAEVSPIEERADAKSFKWLVTASLILMLFFGLAVWFAKPTEVAAPERIIAADNRSGVALATFRNMSGDPAQDYLALGVEHAILTGLAGIPQIAAIRSDAPTRAEYRLEGSVLRDAERIRIDTQLISVADGVVVSTQRYDRTFSGLLAIQSEIESDVVNALALEIDLANRTAQSRGLTDSIEAYDLFLQARAALLPRDQAGNTKAHELYESAIARDPGFARAYGGLALSYAAEFRNGWSDDGDGALARAMTMAQTALSIQPNLPEQHWVVGYVETQRRNLPGAIAALETALRLDPDYADAYALLGGIHTYAGEPEQTLPLLREAMRIRPDAGYLYFLLLGRAYYFLEDCEQATINLNEAITRNTAVVEPRIYRAACLIRQGDQDDAEWEAQEIMNASTGFSLKEFFATYPMVSESQKIRLERDLRRAGLT